MGNDHDQRSEFSPSSSAGRKSIWRVILVAGFLSIAAGAVLPYSAQAACGDGICESLENHAVCPLDCPSPNCGNGICEVMPGQIENGRNCRPDCPSPDCGDGICQADEGYALCPFDCPTQSCGNGICEFMPGGQMENGYNCRPDCPSPDCGDGICQADEGYALCPFDCPTYSCGNGICEFMPGGQMENGYNCRPDCPSPDCGDGICQADEGYALCPSDCPSQSCGNGVCQFDASVIENGQNCRPDCPSPDCGDGICQADQGEDVTTCSQDCAPAFCGDGICQANENYAGCQIDCPSQNCGDGICDISWPGENAVTCRTDCPSPSCGDGICQSGETHMNCFFDCQSENCGNGICEMAPFTGQGEDAGTCRTDCPSPTCGDWICQSGENHTNCFLDCQSQNCGDGICGMELPPGESAGTCRTDCPSPTCGDWICQSWENHTNCFFDCQSENCGNGICEMAPFPGQGEDALTCRTDCPSPSCGDQVCQADEGHILCWSDCRSTTCGDGICQAGPGPDQIENTWTCRPDCPSVHCGDGICQADEGYIFCQIDCPSPNCGDGVCSPEYGEDETTCQPDCGPAVEPLLEALKTADTITHDWSTVNFVNMYPSSPAVLAMMQTTDGRNTAAVRIRELSTASMGIKIEEEQSEDPEMNHRTEVVGYLALDTGVIQDSNNTDIGEAGTVTVSRINRQDWKTVFLTRAYNDPIVIMNIVTVNDAEPCHVRLRNVTASSFQYQIEEWNYLDGRHAVETLFYVVVEKGNHVLFNGKKLEAGSVNANHIWKSVAFAAGFSQEPVLFSHAQTRNGPQAIVTRQRDITSAGAKIRLQEEEGNPGAHKVEKVGYLAVEVTH